MSVSELLRCVEGSAFGLGGEMFEFGNKILLPSSILSRLLEVNAPSPYIFIIRNAFEHGNHETHVGVHEFTAPEECCVLPSWMMNNLALGHGSSVHLRLARHLPDGTFCKVQPQTSEFSTLVGPDAQHTFEMSLQTNYITLTVGDAICMRIGAVPHIFHIRELKPQNAVCILDTTLKIEFMPPVEKEAELQKLELATVAEGEAGAEDAHYFFSLADGESRNILVAVEATSGDPDLFVSRQPRPSLQNHTWQGCSKGSTCVVITPEHHLYTPGTFYVSVHGHKGPAKYRLVVAMTEKTPRELLQLSGQIGEDDLRTSLEDVPEGHTRCSNCLHMIPSANYPLHETMCARRNWCCPICRQVLQVSQKDAHWHCPECGKARDPKIHGHCNVCKKSVRQDDIQKHKEIHHTPMKCRCGKEYELSSLLVHQEFECSTRAESCCYCDQAVPHMELRDHEAFCGGRTTTCPECGESVCNRDKNAHMQLHHTQGLGAAVPSSSASSSPTAAVPSAYAGEASMLETSLDSSVFNCPFCHQHCGSFEDLSQHMQTTH
eukprot:TRINITY_DN8899_c0_g1_i1.p1 TRINITY_DN8899_c0_g1~~TRINITY_DN8899_c0_g1_i1.p1  ORF type:complete len:547 (-),score=159.96 TRINITY_DN8899_c0_g1_i1:152-1792(-)